MWVGGAEALLIWEGDMLLPCRARSPNDSWRRYSAELNIPADVSSPWSSRRNIFMDHLRMGKPSITEGLSLRREEDLGQRSSWMMSKDREDGMLLT